MYALEYVRQGAPATLVEMTPAEFRNLPKVHTSDGAGYRYERLDWTRAHAWVKAGDIHTTALYIDFDGRIRRAGA